MLARSMLPLSALATLGAACRSPAFAPDDPSTSMISPSLAGCTWTETTSSEPPQDPQVISPIESTSTRTWDEKGRFVHSVVESVYSDGSPAFQERDATWSGRCLTRDTARSESGSGTPQVTLTSTDTVCDKHDQPVEIRTTLTIESVLLDGSTPPPTTSESATFYRNRYEGRRLSAAVEVDEGGTPVGFEKTFQWEGQQLVRERWEEPLGQATASGLGGGAADGVLSTEWTHLWDKRLLVGGSYESDLSGPVHLRWQNVYDGQTWLRTDRFTIAEDGSETPSYTTRWVYDGGPFPVGWEQEHPDGSLFDGEITVTCGR